MADGNNGGNSGGDTGENTVANLMDTDGNFVENWADSEALPEEIRGDETLKGVANLSDAMKMLVHAQSMVGADKVVIPGEDADEATLADFRTKLGVPESAEGYEFEEPDLPEGMDYDEQLASDWKTKAHEMGLTPAQAKTAHDWLYERGAETFQSAQQQREQNVADAEQALKSKWGKAYDQNLELANRAADRFGLTDALQERGYANDPAIVEAMAAVGKAMGEDQGQDGGRSGGLMDPSTAQSKINEVMRNSQDPYNLADHPQHKDRVAEVQKWYEQAYPEG